MSDYSREQLLTYVGGPFLILCGVILFGRSLQPLLEGRALAWLEFVCCFPVPAALAAYGIYTIRAGRRKLRGGPWRAEHFMP